MADAEVQVLVYPVERLRVDPPRKVRMLLGPILKNELEIGTDAYCLLEQFLDVFVEEELQSIGHQHEVEDQVLILRLVTHVAHHIPHLLRVLRNQLVTDVPVCLADHVREENCLHLVHQENLSDRLQHLVHRVPECNVTSPGH